MPIFYQTSTSTLSYDVLLKRLNNTSVVQTAYLAENYEDFVINLLCGIVLGIDVIMVDFRNTSKAKEDNKTIVVNPNFSSIEALIRSITNSKASVGIYSSGTEGPPKLIYQPISRLMKSVKVSEEFTNVIWAFTYNPAHSAGIQVLLQSIANHSTLVDLYKCNRHEILNQIASKNITHISATPTFYRMLAPYNFAFEQVTSVTFNGEKSTLELIQNVQKGFPKATIRNIYGSTEAGPLMSSATTTFHIPNRLVGLVKIENDELILHADMVSKSATSDDTWYRTGDIVKIVEQDPLTIEFISRKTRIINVGGHNVNPQEIEEILLTHPDIKDVRVYGRSHKIIGNVIAADVCTILPLSEAELINWCKEKVSNYKRPRIFHFVDEIRTGRTGKKSV